LHNESFKKITDASRKYYIEYAIVNTPCIARIWLCTFSRRSFLSFFIFYNRAGEEKPHRIILRAWKKRSNDCISEVKLQLDPSEISGGCPITSQPTPQKNQRLCYRGTFLRQSVIFAADVWQSETVRAWIVCDKNQILPHPRINDYLVIEETMRRVFFVKRFFAMLINFTTD